MKSLLFALCFLLLEISSPEFSEARRARSVRLEKIIVLFPDTLYEMEITLYGDEGFLTADGVVASIIEGTFSAADLDPRFIKFIEEDKGGYTNCLGYLTRDKGDITQKDFEFWLKENCYRLLDSPPERSVVSKWGKFGNIFKHDIDFIPRMWSGKKGLQKELWSNGENTIVIYRDPGSLEIKHAGYLE